MDLDKDANEFTSRLEEIMPAIELNFEPTPAFGEYKQYLEHAISHPAKANTKLLEFLILNFTKEGDVVLDPMAGSGSTGVVAALHGRNAIQIDIEPKFCEWMEKAKENVEKASTLTPKGWIRNILGDARHLSKLLEQVDTCITSPPYGEAYLGGRDPEKRRERLVKAGYDPKEFLGGKARNAILKHYNEIDTIITSPPYLNVDNVKEDSNEFWRKAKEMGKRWGSKPPSGTEEKQTVAPNNIGRLTLGNVDAIITSPPYAESLSFRAGGGSKKNALGVGLVSDGRGQGQGAPSPYSIADYNIGNLPIGSIDVVITSPPYEEGLSHRRHHTPNTGRTEKLWSEKHLGSYPDSRDNIGTLKSSDDEYRTLSEGRIQELIKKLMKNGKPSYLSEMLKVYHEMYKVLKPNGRAIIIIKPFIRNKKVLDLPYYTYLLMSYCGFVLEKLFKLRLRSKSFWRVLYYRKHPQTPLINHEYILVCRKA